MHTLTSRRSLLMLIAGTPLLSILPGQAFASAQSLLEQMERGRNPQVAIRSTLKLTEYIDGKVNDRMSLTVYTKPATDGSARDIVFIEAPKKDAGKVMLRSGKDLYFYDPDAQNTIRISPQQRLLGQASNGDVLSTNFARDYAATSGGVETVEDAKRNPREVELLKLKARTGQAIYKTVDYWVDTKKMEPVKGRFYSGSGKVLKIAFYDKFRPVFGSNFPTRVMIVDGVDASKASSMEFGDFTEIDMPDSWFQQSFMPRFQKV